MQNLIYKDTSKQIEKIYKYNPLIYSKLELNKLSAYDYAIWNFLFKALQKEIRQKLFVHFHSYKITIELNKLKNFLYSNDNVPKDWLRDIRNSLEKLNKVQIKLEDFELPKEENISDSMIYDENTPTEKYDFLIFNLINDVAVINKNQKTLSCSFSQYFVFFAWIKRNYTHVYLNNFKLKSKYAQRFYEYIELRKSIAKSRNENWKNFAIEKSTLENIVGIKSNSISIIFQKIRINNVIEDLKKVYPDIEIKNIKFQEYVEIKVENE